MVAPTVRVPCAPPVCWTGPVRPLLAHNIGSLAGEFGIIALAPALACRQIDFVRVQDAPDLLHIDVAKRCGDQRAGPAGEPGRRCQIEYTQNPPRRVGRLLGRFAPVTRLVDPGKPVFGVAHPPLRRRTCRAPDPAADLARRKSIRRQQHDPRPQAQPVLRFSRANQAVKLAPLFLALSPSRRFGVASGMCFIATLNHDSHIGDSGA